MTLKEIEREMLREEMEFELTFKNGIKLLATAKVINEYEAEEKFKQVYGEMLEKVELI